MNDQTRDRLHKAINSEILIAPKMPKRIIMPFMLIAFVLLMTGQQLCQAQSNSSKFTVYVRCGLYGNELVKKVESSSDYGCYKLLGRYDIDRQNKGIIDETLVKAGVNTLYPAKEATGLISIDIENKVFQNVKDFDKGNPEFEKSIAALIKLVSVVKKERPNLSVGIYGIPYRFYYENQKARNKDQKLDPLLKVVDYISPSLYIVYPDKEKGFDANNNYLKENLKVALEYGKRLGKPVIPYVWYIVHPTNKKYGKELIGRKEMQSYLNIIRDYQYEGRRAEGVIWWEPGKSNYKLPKDMLESKAKYLSKDEILQQYIMSGFSPD